MMILVDVFCIIGYVCLVIDFIISVKKVVKRKNIDICVFFLTYGAAVVMYTWLVVEIIISFMK